MFHLQSMYYLLHKKINRLLTPNEQHGKWHFPSIRIDCGVIGFNDNKIKT